MSSLEELFENVDSHIIIHFIKEAHSFNLV